MKPPTNVDWKVFQIMSTPCL